MVRREQNLEAGDLRSLQQLAVLETGPTLLLNRLSVVLDDIKPSGARAGDAGPSPGQPDDLDGVFAQLREKASKQVDAAEAQYKKGLALRDAQRTRF